MGSGLDVMMETLSNRYRRGVFVVLLDHNPQDDDDPQVPDDVHLDPDSLQQPLIQMRHTHLPKLEDSGFIEWDRASNTIQKGPQFEEIRPLLELMSNRADELPDDWLWDPSGQSPRTLAEWAMWLRPTCGPRIHRFVLTDQKAEISPSVSKPSTEFTTEYMTISAVVPISVFSADGLDEQIIYVPSIRDRSFSIMVDIPPQYLGKRLAQLQECYSVWSERLMF